MFVSMAYAQGSEAAVQQAAAATGEHSGGFPPFDPSYFASHIFWLIVCFGLFYFFMARVVVPRIGSIIETRRDRIASDLDQAARMKQEADAAVSAYEKELAEARSRANTIAQAASDEAKAKANAERNAAEASLDKKLAGAEKRIAEIRDRAMQDVGEIAEETAAEIVRELIGDSASKGALAKAVKAARD